MNMDESVELPDGVAFAPVGSETSYRIKRGRHGTMLHKANDRFAGEALHRYSEYCEAELQVLLQLVRPGDTVVEAGANIGGHSGPIAKPLHPNAALVALEPQRLTYQLLCANLALNGLWNVYS